MDIIRYIEISSIYRDRNKFPHPSDFDVIWGPPNSLNIVDPIITGTNFLTFGIFSNVVSGGQVDVNTTTINAVVIKQNYTELNTLNTMPFGYDINSDFTILSTDPLYYNGYILTLLNPATFTEIESRVIVGYEPTSATIYVDQSFSVNSIYTNIYYVITNKTFTSDFNQLHLPLYDDFQNKVNLFSQYYTNYYIVNQSKSMYDTIFLNKIDNYNSDLRVIGFSSDIQGDVSDLYSIIKYPTENKFVIVDVDPATQRITLDPSLTYGTGHFVGKYLYNTGIGFFVSSISFPIPSSEWNNQSPIYGSTNVNTAFLITEYSGAPSNILTVSEYSTNNLSFSTYYPKTDLDILGNPATTIVSISSLVRDNFYPLQYSGTVVSQNEAVAYEVTLAQLCLPNVTLTTGSRIAQYPYVYVELRPLGSPSAVGKNVIYSNNPNAKNALFTVAINDVVDPLTSVFVRVYSSQVQTIKIKPNDNFHFSVYLPDGSLFLPVGIENEEYYSPFPPNEFLQIEAVFGFRRL
jgi:hypothetical protein